MQILTVDNECFVLNKIPDQVDEDLRFSVLDNSDPNEPDFYFMPLIYLESFSSLRTCSYFSNYSNFQISWPSSIPFYFLNLTCALCIHQVDSSNLNTSHHIF